MERPTVSVAMATYNGEKYLAEQLNSILAQTYPVHEIIISDDASKDNTLNIIKSFQRRYACIKLFEDTHTKGLNQNFQRALMQCTGDAIAICDQDNIWEPHKLQKMVPRLANHPLVYSDSLCVTKNNVSLNRLSESKKYKFTCGFSPKEFYFYNAVFGHNILLHKKLLQEILPFPEKGLNYDGWISFVASCTSSIDYIDEPLVRYRFHPGNITHPPPQKSKLVETKVTKRQRYNQRLIERLEVFANYRKLPLNEKKFLRNFILELKRQENLFFNLNLLKMMLMNINRLLHHKKIISAFNKSFSQAKGVKLYRLLKQ